MHNGIRVALVPMWGSVALGPTMSHERLVAYACWLAERLGPKPDIFWFNGGDIQGSRRPEVWNALSSTLSSVDACDPFERLEDREGRREKCLAQSADVQHVLTMSTRILMIGNRHTPAPGRPAGADAVP
jgi:hypothetical protein